MTESIQTEAGNLPQTTPCLPEETMQPTATDAVNTAAAAQPEQMQEQSGDDYNDIPDPHLHAPLSPDALPAADEQTDSEAPNGFVKLQLAQPLVQACLDLGYQQPTIVQAQTIPLALAGNSADVEHIDLMVSSQTGSGKTAAFLLPVLHTLLQERQASEAAENLAWQAKLDEAAAKGEPAPKKPRRKNPTDRRNFKAATPGALILCPTRELAQQVAHDAIDLVKHCRNLRVAHVVGGMPYALQIAKLQNADLVVATPGRLLDLQRSMQIKLEQVQFLVVDEADRMLDLGFADDLAEIHQLTSDRRQTMMFSATFAPRIQQLATRVMRNPQRVQIDSPQERHTQIEQKLYWADNFTHKRAMLDHWLRDPSIEQAIVFASTQIECDGLAEDLQQTGFAAVALHGALSQGLRNRRLMALREGRIQFLVATDVAARGIDVPSISHVFNFGLPMKAEDYTHRIGRTGRAGRSGTAVTFAEFRDRNRVWDIEDFTRQPILASTIAGLEPQQRPPARHGKSGAGKGGKWQGNDAPRGRQGFGGGGFGGGAGRGKPAARSRGFGDFNAQAESAAPRSRSGAGFGGQKQGFGGKQEGRSFEQREQRGSGFAPRGGDFAGKPFGGGRRSGAPAGGARFSGPSGAKRGR